MNESAGVTPSDRFRMDELLKSVLLQEILFLSPLLFSNIPASFVYTVCLISDVCIGA